MRNRRTTWLSIALLAILTEAVYSRPSVWRAGLFGSDYRELHARHIAFARDALFGPAHFLPGWYPRELLGAPFAANLQSFPWIPVRFLLLVLPPRLEFLAGVALATLLAAIFSYLFAKRVGLSELASVAAGWTFACAGYFASRVAAGHLPLLEAYPALPLLLWLADRAVDPDRARFRRRDLLALALATACTALAGHPQIPAYAVGSALFYILLRGEGRRVIYALSALSLGVASTFFAWWPMLLLIRRSTRMLDLAPTSNDVAMGSGRLLALILPGVDGWPELLQQHQVFSGYPNDAYFWDTASYMGLLPLFALLFLGTHALFMRQRPSRPFLILTLLGTAAFTLSLPIAKPLHHLIHGTLFRSPSRLFYVCAFCIAIAFGSAVSIIERGAKLNQRFRYALLVALLAGHALDLGGFARLFVRPAPVDDFPAAFQKKIDAEIGDARTASDDPAYYQRYDDAGIFDSILLANPYQALVRLAGLPSDLNEQRVDASSLPIPALQAAGVRFVITSEERTDLECVLRSDDENLYRTADPVPRVSLSESSPGPGASATTYVRRSSDEIEVRATAFTRGFVKVLESFDPGWSAMVDGSAAPVVLADGFAMAVPVQPGEHTLRLSYRTPGRGLGCLLSLASVALFLGLLAMVPKIENPA
ncbi:MAG TPA: hypothetical protein VEV37_03025 [Bryobacteraceae bacterium]|nr:hypothetical protein [Bryobacteraceae bacterium]